MPKPTAATLRVPNQPVESIAWLVDEVLADGVGLLLGQDLGEVLVARRRR